MTTYVLSGRDTATVPMSGPVQVRVTEEGVRVGSGLQALQPDGAEVTAERPAAGVLILRSVPGRLVLRVVPPGGAESFPAGVRAGLRIRPLTGSGAEVEVRSVDLGGWSRRDLAAVETRGPELVVAALDAEREAPLDPLQAAARRAARSALGTDRPPHGRAPRFVVAVDPSASMIPSIADGSLAAAVDILTGLCLVAGPDTGPEIVIAGLAPYRMPPRELPGLGTAVAAEIVRRGLECGFAPDPAQIGAGSGYLVTDGTPAAPDPHWHVLAIGPDGDGRGQPFTALPPPRLGTAADQLLADEHVLHSVLRSLLADQVVSR